METPWLERLRSRLWEEREALGRHEARLIALGRHLWALGRDLLAGELSLRAMSLVYTTLLSVVPFLALGFSVLKALGVHNSLEPLLLELLRPLGAQAAALSANVIGFVERIQVGVLGSLGVALLFYTAISLIQKVEASFNQIWRIPRPRPLAQRVGEYFGVLMVGPVVVFAALGLTASLLNSAVMLTIASFEPLGFLIFLLTRLIPYALIIGLFTFLYAYMPNARVSLRAAGWGGLCAGLLWQSSSLLFASFVAGATNYNAIYSGFAILIFLLIWLYLGWLILLIGCQIAFYVQHPAHLRGGEALPAGSRRRELLGLALMHEVTRRFLAGAPALAAEDHARALGAAPGDLAPVVDTLLRAGLLAEAAGSRPGLILARDPAGLSLADLWLALRGESVPPNGREDRAARQLLARAESAFVEAARGQTLRDWLQTADRAGAYDPATPAAESPR
ncbi:MAG TPA: YhjD/YihY/BrkB family envelope integrity protein [Nevskiaceae bacterium]|nr:YhjD/YihY/BrkB family envelope integrity protein [Nevskiaceae bacterium]